MNLVYPEYSIDIPLKENSVTVFSVENHKAFNKIFSDLWYQANGAEGGFLLSDIEKVYNISKVVDVISNPFSLDCNNRKVLNKLYQELNDIVLDEEFEKSQKIHKEIITYLDEITSKVPYHLQFNLEMDNVGLFKLYDIKMESISENPLEVLINYLRVMNQIGGIQVFVFVNLKQFFEKEELQQLYEVAFYEKIHIIILEGIFTEKYESENCWILDKDLCIIKVD